ncbi:hypothetical protein GCM10022232_67210 [Streptomyces plumbiresistens]|uniref:Uncharacterized protein n=1 Tax=Streptomyces plumbiresistens TaxID=511811 RepID=A0ABP7SQV2_9ACTN
MFPILPDGPNSVICHKDAAQVCRGKRQGSNWGLIFRVRGGCQCRALGWPGVQIAGESTGLGGWAGGCTSKFRRGRTGPCRRKENGKSDKESCGESGGSGEASGGFGQ